ncbi:nucleolar and coiled-body phosphoprotein 1-like [Rhinatrema bivittatum]|uniref:nucleolar and coiled-body phosphoprotein 1-like n=1 Tax=Rhinatrema bivittatum TaxID=194408 RepID=UPI00112ED81D|nr:nucleolar and coiled-body phosphoprotein 1-like [Rhinatrema bivittatum]
MPVLRNLPIRRRIELEAKAAAAAVALPSSEKPEAGYSHSSLHWVETKISEQDGPMQTRQNSSCNMETLASSRMPTRHRPNWEVPTMSLESSRPFIPRLRLLAEDEAFETMEIDCKTLPLPSSGERLKEDSPPLIQKRKRGRPPKVSKAETSLEFQSLEQSPVPEKLQPHEMSPHGKAISESWNSRRVSADCTKLSPEIQATSKDRTTPSDKKTLSLTLKTPSPAENESISSTGSSVEKRNKKLIKEKCTSAKHSDSQAAGTGVTPQKRKRGRPPKVQTPPGREKSCLSPISNEESSFDEASSLRHQTKKPVRKKKRKAPGDELLMHKVRRGPTADQHMLSDSESSSDAEGKKPLPTETQKREATKDSKGLDSGSEASTRITRSSAVSWTARTDSDSEAAKQVPSKQDLKADKTMAMGRPDDTSSLESSASELRSPPRGRCTRQCPGDLVPALESEKRLTKLPPQKRQNSSDESVSGQHRARAESWDETLSDDDRPQKRLRGGSDRDSDESEKMKKRRQLHVSEHTANRVLRSVAAAAAAAATTPAGNTRSSSSSSSITTPPPTAPSPTLGRKSGTPAAVVTSSLSHRGRKPKT